MALMAIDWNPDRRKLRSFALTWLAAFGIAGLVVAWRNGLIGGAAGPAGSWTRPLLLWTAAVLIPAIGLRFPQAVKAIYIVWMGVTFPIGWVVSHAMLAIVYFGLFTLVGAIFRLTGRDPLGLRFDRTAATYWVRRPPRADRQRYFRQF
jgi:hypothetical protein